MSSLCQAGNPPQTEQAHQRMLEIVGSAADRIGHDLLGLTVPLRAVLEAMAANGDEVSSGPEACRIIERFGAGLQMLAATERMSVTADLGQVYETMQPLLRATLPRGVALCADLGEDSSVIGEGRESVAQALFRCLHATAASAVPGDRLVVQCRPASEANAIELRFSLEVSDPGRAGDARLAADLLPGHDDPLLERLGASIEAGAGPQAPTVVLTIPLAQ